MKPGQQEITQAVLVLTQTTDSRTPGRQQPEEDGEVEAGEDIALEEADFLASGSSRGKELYL